MLPLLRALAGVCLWATVAHAAVWRVVDYFPNPSLAAVGAARLESVSDGATALTRFYLFAWDAAQATGIFYQSVNEPQQGELCPTLPAGVHAGYGRPGAGYDWYGVDTVGHHYLGWMAYGADCSVEVGGVVDPYGTIAYPRAIDDTAPLPAPRTFSVAAQVTRYRPDGALRDTLPVVSMSYTLEVLQPGGPGTLLGLKVSDPMGPWFVIDWLSGKASCRVSRCWPALPCMVALGVHQASQRGVWRIDSALADGTPLSATIQWACP